MRILLADQDSTQLEAVARALGDTFSVDVATSKTTCIDLLRANNQFSVVVATERLSDGSGLELLSQMSKRWPETLRVFSIEPSRLPLIATHLKPFRLFQTIPYPINPDKLRNVLILAQAAQTANADTASVEHIVMGDDTIAEEPPAIAAGAPMSGRGRAAVVAPLRAPAPARPPQRAPSPLPTVRGDRRVGDRRSAPPPPPPPPPRRREEASDFPALGSLAEAAQIAAALRASAPPPPKFRLSRIVIPVALIVAIAGGVFAYQQMNPREVVPAPVAAPAPTLASEPTTVPGVSSIVAEIESALTADDFVRARASVNKLRQVVPDHPRLSFLDALVRRGEESQQIARASNRAPASPEPTRTSRASPPAAAPRPNVAVARNEGPPPAEAPRTFGAPIPAPLPRKSAEEMPLPEKFPQAGAVFSGRTLEESSIPAPAPAPETNAAPAQPPSVDSTQSAGTAATALAPPPASAPAQAPAPKIVPSRLLKQVAPEYPRAAQRDGIEGFVQLEFTITADGTVEDVHVVTATPAGLFDKAAIAAVRRWKYAPRTENGVPVEVQTKTRIEFQLAK